MLTKEAVEDYRQSLEKKLAEHDARGERVFGIEIGNSTWFVLPTETREEFIERVIRTVSGG